MRFRKLYGGIPNGVCFKAEFVGLSTAGVTDLQKIQFESLTDEADEQQAHIMITKTETRIHRHLETNANKSNTNTYGRKGHEKKRPYTNACGKERKDRPQNLMLVAKKERANHKCWWQTQNGFPNQSSKQLTRNGRNKTAETATSKPQTVAYLQA